MPLRALVVPVSALLLVLGLSLSVSTGNPVTWQAIGLSLLIGAVAGSLVSLALRRLPVLLLVLTLPLALGCLRGAEAAVHVAQPWNDLPNRTVRLVVEVDAEPEPRSGATLVFTRLVALYDPESQPPPGRLRLTLPPLTSYPMGQRLWIEGRLQPVDASTPWGQRLLRQGVVATASYPVVIPEPNTSERPPLAIQAIRSAISQAAFSALPEPQASLQSGMLVGTTGGMSDPFRQALVASGTTHIVVVSGYNVSIVAAALARLRWAHWTAHLVPLAGIWLFAGLAVGSPPSLRAALMASVGILAIATGRGRDALLALLLAVAIMLLVDPLLALDLGFQLSALATLGLITLQPRVADGLSWMHQSIREPLSATLAAQLATLPVLASTFHVVSVVSPLSNVLIAPLVPVTTILGAILLPWVAILGWLAMPVGVLLAIPTSAIAAIVEHTARAPSATRAVGELGTPVVAGYVCLLLAWVGIPTAEGRRFLSWMSSSGLIRPAAAGLLGVAAFGAVAWSGARETDSTLTITILDVGHGDAVLVRAPDGRTVLIDGGPDSALLLDRLGRRLGLLERNLSALVLTRSDAERLPGSVAAAERYPPSLVVEPPEGSTLALHERWRSAVRGARRVSGEQAVALELSPGVSVETLPLPATSGTAPPARTQRSLAVRIAFREVAVLVAPGLTPGAASVLESQGHRLSATALVVPRRGDAAGLDEATLRSVNPSIAVIPVGARTREALPSATVLQLLKGVPTYRTDLHGSVELRSNGHSLWITTERPGP